MDELETVILTLAIITQIAVIWMALNVSAIRRHLETREGRPGDSA